MYKEQRIAFYSAAALCLSGCGSHAPPNIDPSFADLVDKWNNLYTQPVNVDMQFADLDGTSSDIVGQCQYTDEVSNPVGQIVLIDRTFWNNAVNVVREQLVFHELGHCVLLMVKHDCTMSGIKPESIMFPRIFSQYTNGDSIYADNEAYYIAELPNSKQDCP
jgi:hypothetical protein